MATRRALVLIDGQIAELPSGDGLAGAAGGGAALAGTAVVTPPQWSYSHTETVAAAGVTGASRIFLSLGAFLDSDENSAEFLDIAAMSGWPETNTITVTMAFLTPTLGPIKLNWSAV
jgi:hypothetical protein